MAMVCHSMRQKRPAMGNALAMLDHMAGVVLVVFGLYRWLKEQRNLGTTDPAGHSVESCG